MKKNTYNELMKKFHKEWDRADRYCTERDKAKAELGGKEAEIGRLKLQIRELEKQTYHLLKEIEDLKK